VKDGAFYGWPFSYYGQHVDDRVMPQRPDLVAKAVVPDDALGNHTASLGLAFSIAAGTIQKRRIYSNMAHGIASRSAVIR
jgi:glucose/arabinose dehydrogenase